MAFLASAADSAAAELLQASVSMSPFSSARALAPLSLALFASASASSMRARYSPSRPLRSAMTACASGSLRGMSAVVGSLTQPSASTSKRSSSARRIALRSCVWACSIQKRVFSRTEAIAIASVSATPMRPSTSSRKNNALSASSPFHEWRKGPVTRSLCRLSVRPWWWRACARLWLPPPDLKVLIVQPGEISGHRSPRSTTSRFLFRHVGVLVPSPEPPVAADRPLVCSGSV